LIMMFKKLLIPGIAAVFLFQCNPKTILTGVTHTSDVDSVLFYQQKPVSDPFLDEIASDPGNEARLTAILYPPPPPPPPAYREIEGFRIQVFAGTDSLSAASVKQNVGRDTDDNVYLLHEGGLYKIQVGNFPYRMEADNMKLTLKDKGYEGAWVVKRMIHVPRDSTMSDTTMTPAPSKLPAQISVEKTQSALPDSAVDTSLTTGARFKIQVMATSDEIKARQLELELEEQFDANAYFEHSGQIYKVYIGKFDSRPKAEILLKEVRENGYPDAWLVY
jgi:cell division septation protein DedD